MFTKEQQAIEVLKVLSETHENLWAMVEKLLVDNITGLEYVVYKGNDGFYRVTLEIYDEPSIVMRRPFKHKSDAEEYGSGYIDRLYQIKNNGENKSS